MATTLYVGAGNYTTIKEALSLANDGDTIIVNAGDYTDEGTITINKSITIQAANAATTAADADKAIIDNIVINGGSDGNLLTVEIDGLQINAKTKNDMNWSQGVYLGTLYTESVTVRNCNIDLTNGQPGSSGIKMSLNHGDNTETIVIENNIITGSAENTNSLIHIGDKENLKSLSVKGNTLSGCSSHGMNFDFEAATAYSIEIANNKVSVCGRDGIKLGGLKNADSTVTITENEVAHVNNARCDDNDAAIALRGSGELQEVTVTGNKVINAQVGVYFDTKVVNDTADDQAANITVSNNNIAIVEKHAPGVGETPAASGVSGFEP
ncbi:MAG: hypothetical protein IKC82_00405, partial [Lentisphaeria bacterium]|nr:hypothetical protein [Lentisphaeria bacterium]